MAGPTLYQDWNLDPATFLSEWAARVEVAAGGWVHRARHLARDNGLLAPHCRIGRRSGVEQRLRIRMQGAGEERAAIGDLDYPPEIHHRDTVADMLHHRDRAR